MTRGRFPRCKFFLGWLSRCNSDLLDMKNRWYPLALVLALTLSLQAQEWSFGAATGPFVFGDFFERRMRPVNAEGAEEPVTMVLSAATRPGLALDFERSLGLRWAVRAEGTFTRAPLSVREEGVEDGVALDAGDLDVSTWMVPVIFRINPRGSFRFHLLAGPAIAIYRAHTRENAVGTVPLFRGTRSEWGYAFGGGASWWVSDRFAIEGNLTDTITSSPFDEENLPDVPGITIPNPHNVHTTVGLRWKF